MIKILGAKRLLALALLIALNASLGALVYLYLAPYAGQKTAELRSLDAHVSGVRSDINRMQIEFDQLTAQQARFDKLKRQGFFNSQERNQAEKVFETIQKQAGVISAVANIKAGTVEDNAEAAKADYKILSSPVAIHVEALDGVDVLRYIYLLERFFPGHVAFTNIQVERKSEVTGAVLRSIASGANPVLVDADIGIVWRTMIPKSEVMSKSGHPQGNGT